ncbi:C3 and PZP-like alpha-2-macroglobulin domain-containing protein 8 [Sceloporus undulatus]|uniref:C3 and PZP-like alpha-2-macroglobulin domain-containing protein 8 n=1 Tax=Sceloporus undulatus TaxID=8520 RepID=UPI001C4C60C3|nr:C3 and PZP-like alpha-2-macroglobulin domain-containing protein 8 [Sceloporus undulatus]
MLSGMQPGNITLERSRRAAPWPLPTGSRTIRITHVAAPTHPTPAPETCMTSVRFRITPSMVPLGRLLVYYVRENGEGVADSLQFAVQPSFENQVSVAFSANETQPGDSIAIKVRATKGSCVCLAAVDKSVYLLKPGFQLDSAKASDLFLWGKIWVNVGGAGG